MLCNTWSHGRLRSGRRAESPGTAGCTGRRRANGRRTRRDPPQADAADRVASPAGAARGRPRRGATRRAAAHLCVACRRARRDRRMDRTLSPLLGRSPRCPGTAPSSDPWGARVSGRDGRLTVEGDRAVLTFERRLSFPIEAVWTAITDPDERAKWFGVTTIDGREGGTIDMVATGPPLP